MSVRIALLIACLTAPAFAEVRTLRLAGEPRERPFAFDISGSYEPSPGTIIIRDAAFGTLGGAVLGAAIGAAADSNHWGRDLAIGAGVGLVLGVLVGTVDANSGPHVSIHADQAG